MSGTVWVAALRVLDNDFQKGKVNLSLGETSLKSLRLRKLLD